MASYIQPSRPFSFPSIHHYDQPAPPSSLSSPFLYLDQSALTSFFAGSPNMMPITAKSSKMRRKSSSTMEQVKKHRRTRSGCLTCRHRRVKCDETRPICERCQKGGRECVYPEPPVAKSSTTSGGSKARKESRTTNSSAVSIKEQSSSPEGTLYDEDDYYPETDEAEHSVASSPIHPHLLNPTTFPGHKRRASSKTIRSPYLVNDPLRSRSVPHLGLGGYSPSISANKERIFKLEYNIIPRQAFISDSLSSQISQFGRNISTNMQFYLNFLQQSMTCHHYLMKQDPANFFKFVLVEYSLQNEALLHSVVAFASFHFHVHMASKKHEDFLEYYNKSLELLRLSFAPDKKPDLATLMTILQIATFEEYLGDWSNLVQHCKGAYSIMTSLYTPTTIFDTIEGTMIFAWFSRLDNFAATIAGQQTILPREWLDRGVDHCKRQLNLESITHMSTYDYLEAQSRMLKSDVANVLAKRSKGLINSQEFADAAATLQRQISEFWQQLDPQLSGLHSQLSTYAISTENMSFSYNAELAQIFDQDYISASYIFAEIHALALILMHQTSFANGAHNEFMRYNALSICKIFAAFETYSGNARDNILPLHNALSIAAVFMPDHEYRVWCRSKFAMLEDMGLLCPVSFRHQLANAWNQPDLRFSWLPFSMATSSLTSLDGGIIMSIRNLAEIRDAEMPMNQSSLDIKNTTNLFGFVDMNQSDASTNQPYINFQQPDFTGSGFFETFDNPQADGSIFYHH